MWILPPTFPPSSPYPVLPRGTQHTQPVLQGCQAEIPAKKLKRGHRKKNFWPNFGWFYQKQAEKGPQKIFKRCSLFLAVITVINLIFNIQYTNFLRPLFCLFLVKISQNSARNFFLWPLLSFLAGISAWQPCNTISWTACILNWEENYSGGGCHFSGRFIFARSVFDAQMS